jgi:hypothetical protein
MTSRGPRLRATLAATLILSHLVAVTAAARAGDDEGTPVSVLIGDAVAEYDAGHFQEARALFRQAHERQPTARTLRGIGMCSFELRDYVEATRSLSASLRETRRPLTSEQKRHAELLLARALTFVGRFTVKMKPASASLFVDGHPGELEPDGMLLLSFGRHQLSLRCSSCAPTEKEEEITVAGGEQRTIEMALAPAPPTPPPDTSGGSGTAGTGNGAGGTGNGTAGGLNQPGGDTDSSAGRSNAHIWFTGAAIAAALGAGGSVLWWVDRDKELDVCRTGEVGNMMECTSESTIVSQRRTAIGLTIGLGAAAVVSGVVAGLLWPHSEQSASASTVACVPGNNMVSCAFRF